MTGVLGIYNYWIYVVLMMIGLYGVIAKPNLIKQAIALGLFQTGIFLYYISMAVIDGGTTRSPEAIAVFSNAHSLPRNMATRTGPGRKLLRRGCTNRPSASSPPAVTRQCTWGWCDSVRPQVCSDMRMPGVAPRWRGSASS